MADAVGCVTKAVDLALKIKDAVATVRQNRKDCAHIKRRVERVGHTLSLCEGNAELMDSPAVCDAVEALAEVLGEALELVTGCQEETNAVWLCCTAGKLSKQLGKVDRGISDGNCDASFAILVYHISKQTREGAGPAMPTDQDAEGRQHIPSEGEEDDYGGDGTLLQEITRVTLAIRTAMETVRRNKDECVQVDKIASRVSLLLPRLEHRETTEDGGVRRALNRLLKSFRRAHKLVVACQRRSVVVVLCSPRKLSNDLRWVLDYMMREISCLIDVISSDD